MSTTPPIAPRPLGRTGLAVTPICVGTSPLASMPRLYGYEVDDDRAVATVEAAFAGPFDFVDTSNGYGDHGEAEVRIGIAIRRAGGLPAGVVLATKVDPAPGSSDFSGDRVRRSFEESLERLGVDRVPLLHLHDPERISFEEGVAPGGPLEALVALREQGLVDRIGVAGGPVPLLQRYLDTGAFDVVLSHNRYTLLDRSAEGLFAAAAAAGIGVINAAPYGGGMLVKGPDVQTKYAYGERDEGIAAAARAMAAACARYDVPLPAAALQFSLRSPHVHSTVVGMSSPERVAATAGLAAVPVPDDLWAELEALVPAADGWLDPPA
ncbi:aldo/keto reductase [Amnibacterium setariae]|uniref:aldo/keto reductase n=1 Tax=Amnibacterium setariae TaxID=2306585 RepID=UPI001F46EA9B|nr:aldo/keto reductase [Amnibacterium setariae]